MEEELLRALDMVITVATEKQITADNEVVQSSELTKSFMASEMIRFIKGGITARELVQHICEF